MFEILFGWRKASTCKKLIRRVQCRLKLLKNKRESIIRQFRQDVVQLIKSGHQDRAFTRIEELYKDQSLKRVYDMLDNFCEFVIINLSYIRRHRDCPNDINEAVSSLLYASARCGDLPELIKLRKLFSERYGQKFAVTAVELLHGNLVNCQIIENLYVKSIPYDLKFNLLKEIARENCLQLDMPGVDGEFDLQHHSISNISMESCKVEWIEPDSGRDIQYIYDGIDGSKLQASYEKEIQEIAKSNTSTSDWKKLAEIPHSYSCPDMKNNSISDIVAVQSAQDRLDSSSSSLIPESSVNIEKHEVLDSLDEPEMVLLISSCQSNPRRFSSSAVSCVPPQHKAEKVTRAASESSSSLSDRNIVYLDDVEELQTSMKEDVIDKDQRLFKFKSSIPSVRKNRAAITNKIPGIQQVPIQPFEPSDGKSSTKSASKRSPRKRLNSRQVPVENLAMKDVECALYYGESDSSPDDDLFSLRSYSQNKHQRKMSDAESVASSLANHRRKLSSPKSPFFYAWRMTDGTRCKEIGKQYQSQKCKTNHRSRCSLDITGDENDDWEYPYPTRRSTPKTSEEFPSRILDERKCEALSINVTTNHKSFKDTTDKAMSKEVDEAEVIDCQPSCASSCSRTTSPWIRTRPPYIRAMTMPPERPKGTPSYQILRSTSCLPEEHCHSNIDSPSYVHPKLPDYDDLAARLSAIRTEQLAK